LQISLKRKIPYNYFNKGHSLSVQVIVRKYNFNIGKEKLRFRILFLGSFSSTS